jgi:hypothetical protein
MTFRRNRSGPGAALSAALFCLSFTPALLAQESSEPSAEGEAGPAAADTAPADAAPADAAPEQKEEAPAESEPPAAAEAKPAEPAAVPAGEADVHRATIGIERLDGDAFPSPQTRGIPGGSLGFTMHGLQAPYLPAVGAGGMRVGVSGSLWSDGSYAFIKSGLAPDTPSQKRLAMQSRGVLRVTPTYSTASGWFAQAQGEFVALGDQALDTGTNVMGFTDDAYVRAGKWDLIDIQVGRFQGWEIANHYGMGLDLNTLERDGAVIDSQTEKPKDAYGLTYFWDRADGRMGSYAVHVYPLEFLRFELLGQFGAGTNLGQAIQTNFRPSGILDFGFVKLKGGFEYGKAIHQEDDVESQRESSSRNGYGVALQFVLDPYVEAGASYSMGFEDKNNLFTGLRDDAASNTVTGISGFVNGRVIEGLVLGVGALYSRWENLAVDERPGSVHFGEHDFDRQFQAFGAVQYSFWDVFYLKFVGAYAHWRHQDRASTPFANKMTSARLRFMVLF